MASGVCVVATAVGGNADLLGHGRYGALVPPEDPAALASAIVDLIRDPSRRLTMATAAREHVKRNYSELSMIAQYETLYSDISASREATAASIERLACVE
jgi:glycosyltransferase involved in cell wall biosynthesis